MIEEIKKLYSKSGSVPDDGYNKGWNDAIKEVLKILNPSEEVPDITGISDITKLTVVQATTPPNTTTGTIVIHECCKCHICGGSVYSDTPFSNNSFEVNTICHECKDAIKWVKNQMKSNGYAL